MKNNSNTWMYLFFATLLLWVGTITYSCEPQKTSEPTAAVEEVKEPVEATDPCQGAKVDTIPRKSALSSIANYQNYLSGKLTVVNPDVRYFALPHCELSEMIDQMGRGNDIQAHLAVRNIADQDNGGKVVPQITLVFSDTPTSANAAATVYYDFVKPCPRDCPKE